MALVDDLKDARDNLGTIIKNQTAAWVTAGCPPTLSIDGESYDWNGWLASKLDAMQKLTEQIRQASSPFMVRSRGRA